MRRASKKALSWEHARDEPRPLAPRLGRAADAVACSPPGLRPLTEALETADLMAAKQFCPNSATSNNQSNDRISIEVDRNVSSPAL